MALWDTAAERGRARHSHPWLAELLFALDVHLRRRQAVYEYTQNPTCIFRLEIARAPAPVVLRDGTRVGAGQRLAKVHFWNEHIPPVPPNGATIAWARHMQRVITASLAELARHLASRRDLDDIAMICGEVPSATTRPECDKISRIMGYYGFESIAEPKPLPLGERLHRLGENILVSLTVFAQNAAALRPGTLHRVRVPIYLSRQVLERKFGAANKPSPVTEEVS